ncbi:hypothetical protein OO009_01925 [Flavobacteriaceae bacterium KMM 6897]|nr:hypothetical protein [Flavobacteriaceae bacterium KMM 6897]MEB8346424.1 hypothetical protein [Flavobacteriaceae bacterium KMM 6898]
MQKCLILFSILVAVLIFASLTADNEVLKKNQTVNMDNMGVDDILKKDIEDTDKSLANK